MSEFVIDLPSLPFPDIIDPLDYETILADMKTTLLTKYPVADVESEPLIALLETCAYYRVLDRARVNDSAKAVMIAYATGADLDNLGAFFGVTRRVIVVADPEANPPVVEVLEADDEMRRRILLALEAQSSAGPRGAYAYHALSADPEVYDVAVVGPDDDTPLAPSPGNVEVYILGRTQSPNAALLDKVQDALSDEDVRPLCDSPAARAATVTTFDVTAEMTFYEGPDSAVVMAAARAALDQYATTHYRLGHDIKRSGIIAALHQPGVYDVDLTEPAADIANDWDSAAKLGTVTLTDGGTDV